MGFSNASPGLSGGGGGGGEDLAATLAIGADANSVAITGLTSLDSHVNVNLAGGVTVGGTTATSVSIGRAAHSTTVLGVLKCTQGFSAPGQTMTVGAVRLEANQSVYGLGAMDVISGSGDFRMTVRSGNAGADSGDVRIDVGLANGNSLGGTPGDVNIGDTNASAVNLGRAAFGVDIPGHILAAEAAAPGTPAAGKVALYARSGLLYSKDDAGLESPVSGGGGADDANSILAGQVFG